MPKRSINPALRIADRPRCSGQSRFTGYNCANPADDLNPAMNSADLGPQCPPESLLDDHQPTVRSHRRLCHGGNDMFRLNMGRTSRYCDGISRRHFLQLGVAGMAAVGLPQILRAKNESAAAGQTKNTSVILIWLDGGPSHLDLYDMKPEAPEEYRGIWKPIRTKVPGFDITELFPLQA